MADASEMDKVQAGDILVTDMTDPNWEPVMKLASAIVTTAESLRGIEPWPGSPRTAVQVGVFYRRESAPRAYAWNGYGARFGVARGRRGADGVVRCAVLERRC